MTSIEVSPYESGSRWRRWDPHVHAPGTIQNDQFGTANAWGRYLGELEARLPAIEALGITDYYNLDTYERVVQEKQAGRLRGCTLVFPNVELRLALGTVKGHWVNVHLLISPEDPNHLTETRRFLSRLTYNAFDDTFCCTPDDLVKLGHCAGAPANSRAAALKLGSEQFKVDFNQLQKQHAGNGWTRDNILIAVAGGNDGTSGLRDGADATTRKEVEKFAHLVFSSAPAQREFWLGERAVSADELKRSYGGLKPCIHGSDGHSHADAGVPAKDRYTWIKGEASFDALRQACIDPAGRAHVGDAPPISTLSSQVISTVTLSDAPWATTSRIQLNPGLVAIIGARGSGKTALADIIAKGCDAGPAPDNQQSFLYRAQEFLDNASVTLTWGSGDDEQRSLTDGIDEYETYPRARYLSQQFVDSLCSSYGMTDALLREIERVIFDAHPVSDRDGAVDFNDLLTLRATRYRQAREREEEALASLSEQIGTELEKMKLVVSYDSQVKEKMGLIRRTEADRSKLVAKGSEARLARLQELTKAAERVRQNLRYFNLRSQDLLIMQDEVADRRKNKAPDELRAIQRQHAASGLNDNDWKPFLTDYVGQVDQTLSEKLQEAQTLGSGWRGNPPPTLADANASYLADGADLLRQPLAILEAEISRLQQLVSLDKATADRFASLSSRIVQEIELLVGLKEKLADAQGAKARVTGLQNEREACYQKVIDAILFEQRVLSGLYAPIQTRLSGSNGTLRKLSFSVTRSADVVSWAKRGEEELIDLRRQGQFRGRGSLQQLAEHYLKDAWESGDGNAVSLAMKDFRDAHQEALLDQARVSKANPIEYRAWLKRFAQWLYSTDHITINYSVEYDGTDIRKLSPGTRGIVLLLLYLALDDADDRPLIIDQPEENLDPKSIYDELVGLFIAAKARRQVIMVTHNANLVINTDADQIIVADVGPRSSGSLPPITYLSGGLERADIRKAVCNILEGGEHAFRERARRLRVRLQR